ncbi:MAG: four helix bundle protein [Candidatus Liptonbacteria bacterium]|nr:four helix bundle protein [Candidatus Liptonbacteria bacterium]
MKNDNEKFKAEFKKRLYDWVLKLIRFVDKLPKDSASTIIVNQLSRSGTSVLANYVEAGVASSKKDFINFFHHSLKSANESKMWLALLRDAGKGSREEIESLLDELIQLANILGSSILTLKGRR